MKCLVRPIFFIIFARNISIYILIATIQFFFALLVPSSLYSCFYESTKGLEVDRLALQP